MTNSIKIVAMWTSEMCSLRASSVWLYMEWKFAITTADKIKKILPQMLPQCLSML